MDVLDCLKEIEKAVIQSLDSLISRAAVQGSAHDGRYGLFQGVTANLNSLY